MPITYEFDVGSGVVFTRMSGILTDDEVLAYMHALRADEGLREGVRQLIDVTGVTDLAVTPDGIRKFNSLGRVAPIGHRIAIVASTDLTFGMARMYQLNRPDDLVGVFRTEGEARAWLGLDARS